MQKIKTILYWIRLPHHSDISNDGYIGVTNDFENRMREHKSEIQKNTHKNKHLTNAVKKYGWENLIKEVVIIDDENICYIKEYELRPKKMIGWNIAPGGHKGPGRKKGQKASPDSIEKMRNTIKLRNERIRLGNLNEDDRLFLEKKQERKLITEKKKEEKRKQALQEKELKRLRKIQNADNEKKQKIINRTQGVVHTNQQPRPLCKNCNISLAKPNGISKHGFRKWHKYCASCAKAAYNNKFGYLLNKKTKCEQCGFVATDTCQLDIVYKDENTKNKLKSNMKTLCANCNRLYQKKLRSKKKSILDITVDTDLTI